MEPTSMWKKSIKVWYLLSMSQMLSFDVREHFPVYVSTTTSTSDLSQRMSLHSMSFFVIP